VGVTAGLKPVVDIGALDEWIRRRVDTALTWMGTELQVAASSGSLVPTRRPLIEGIRDSWPRLVLEILRHEVARLSMIKRAHSRVRASRHSMDAFLTSDSPT